MCPSGTQHQVRTLLSRSEISRSERAARPTGTSEIRGERTPRAMDPEDSDSGFEELRRITVPVSDVNYQTPAGSSVKWDRQKALDLFHSLREN